MKKLRKILSVLASLAILGTGFLTSCSGDDETEIVKPNVTIEKGILISGHTSDRIKVGSTEQLTATVYPDSESGSAITWHSSDEDVVSVTQEGLVTALDTSDEKVQVWAQFADGTKSNIINYQVQIVVPKISGVELVTAPTKGKYATGTAIDLTGLKIKVNYDVSVPSDLAEDYPAQVEYSTENAGLFEVSGDTSSAGDVSVTVTYKPVDTEFVANATSTVTFTVKAIAATVISVTVNTEKSKSEYTFGTEIDALDVTLDIVYSEESLNESVSAVDPGATIKVGNEQVTWASIVSANDFASSDSVTKALTFVYGGTSSAAYTVTITPVPVTSITISAAGGATSVEKGSTLAFTATVEPENATIQTVTWSIEAASTGATIDATTGVLSAESITAAGTVKVKATSSRWNTVVSEEKEITIPAWITGISVTTNPTKTEYLKGGTLDTAGMVVTATYSDSTTAETTDYTVGTTTLSTAGGSVVVTVTSTKDTSLTATFNVKVLRIYEHEIDLSGDTKNDTDWWTNTYPYSGISAQTNDNDVNGEKTRFSPTGSETDFTAYLANRGTSANGGHIWLQKGASTLYRADNQALFLDRAPTSEGETALPVLLATEVAEKYRIELDIKATGSKNTGRKIYIKTLEENTATADSSTTKVFVKGDTVMETVFEGTHSSTNVHTISYEYTGDKPYSIVGVDLDAGGAVYIAAIRLYTTQEKITEPSIVIHATSVSILDKDESTVLAKTGDTGKALALKKGAGTYNLSAKVTPNAATEQSVTFALESSDSNNGVTLSSDGTITVADDISSSYTGTITATVTGTSPAITATLALTVDASDTTLASESSQLSLSKVKNEGGSVTLTAEVSPAVSEKLTWVWKKGDTEVTGADTTGMTSVLTIASDDVPETATTYSVTVTGTTSGESAALTKSTTVNKGASVDLNFNSYTALANSSANTELLTNTENFSLKSNNNNAALKEYTATVTMNEKTVSFTKAVQTGSNGKAFIITPKSDGTLELCFSCTNSSGTSKSQNLTVSGTGITTVTAALTGTASVIKIEGVKADTAITCAIAGERLNFFGAVLY